MQSERAASLSDLPPWWRATSSYTHDLEAPYAAANSDGLCPSPTTAVMSRRAFDIRSPGLRICGALGARSEGLEPPNPLIRSKILGVQISP